MSSARISSKQLTQLYMWGTVLIGSVAFVFSASRVNTQLFDIRLFALIVLTVFFSSRIVIPIPRFCSQISVSDTFIFLALLLYGAEAAVLLAASEALLSSFRFSRKPITVLFNWACAAISTLVTALVLRAFFADLIPLHGELSPRFVGAISVMALSQYVTNSGIVAVCGALKAAQPIWLTWKKYYLWTSITYFAGACAAALIAQLINQIGFYAFLITVPTIAIIFLTYRTYLKNIEASAAQAEQAEQHIEELSHYIAEQDRIREQFSQVEKLSALGELASGVAHDFNNTLAGILGRAQLLLRTNDPEKIKRGLNIIIKTAEDGAKTVKRIQDFARQRRDHDFESVLVDQILLDVSEITRPRWKDRAEAANIQISLDLQIRCQSKIMGDESELREVLVNMVFNAVDAMPEGGRLTLSAEDVDGSVVISVADTGTGMSSDVRSRIFDPFFTTKGKAGMGLGLAVSFGIIRRHEGTIAVESEPGQGTRFRITLPASKMEDSLPTEPAAAHQTTAVEPSSLPVDLSKTNQPNILVVDDEDCVRELLRDLLEAEGCRVYLAEGGREALALYEARKFDCVFTDVGMPGMSGWELAHAIRQRNQTIPIAVITGWGEAVGSNEQKEAAVDWVITKPFTDRRISELVEEINRQRDVAIKRAAFAIVAA
jgi:signal transduction histidine kinase/ActR/RegA family two-component response regulator